MSNRKSRPARAANTAAPARKSKATATPKPAHGRRKVQLPSAKALATAVRKPATPQLPAPGPHTIGGIRQQEPAKVEAATPKTPEIPAPLPEPQTVRVSLNRLAAALTVAPTKEQRHYMNGVYIHQVGAELRLVASDGHRMLVLSQDQHEALAWGEAGIILPADQLAQVMKYTGKDAEDTLTISYGTGHQHATIVQGFGTFQVRPIDGEFPPYARVLDDIGGTLTGEREMLTTGGMNAKFVRSAGAVSAALESDALFFFPGTGDKPTLFTFGGCPGALLIITVAKMDVPALQGQTIRMIGERGMASSISALKAHATRNDQAAKAATTEKDRERFAGLAENFRARIQAIMVGLKPALPAPAASQEKAAA